MKARDSGEERGAGSSLIGSESIISVEVFGQIAIFGAGAGVGDSRRGPLSVRKG
jgi:hypothetical protein